LFGRGREDHLPPHFALGNHTMIGFGYNHSDIVLDGRERGTHLSSVPYTKEWCTLKI
jgi:hypothetical protein